MTSDPEKSDAPETSPAASDDAPNAPAVTPPEAALAPRPEPKTKGLPPDTHTWVFPALAAALPLAFFFVLPPLTKSGLWDPYELNVADLGRRIALNLFGAGSLLLTGADNSLPHLNDL